MRKHSFDPASFVLGLVITGVAVAYLVAEAQDRTVDGAWVLPLTLIGLGVAAVAAGLNRALRRPAAAVELGGTSVETAATDIEATPQGAEVPAAEALDGEDV